MNYLLAAWGQGQTELAKLFTPHKTHEGTLYWWFETRNDRAAFKKRISLAGVGTIVTAEYNPIDDDGNETDTHKRTIAIMLIQVPGEDTPRKLEHDFGYGYPADSARHMFEEGNYSCDCNRAIFLGLENIECGHNLVMTDFRTEERD